MKTTSLQLPFTYAEFFQIAIDKIKFQVELISMADKFINIDDLHIDLIDRVNPFQKAFEILSKSLTTKIFKVIQDTIEATRVQMSDEKPSCFGPRSRTS